MYVEIIADRQFPIVEIDEDGNEYIPLPYFESGDDNDFVIVTASVATIITNGGNDIVVSFGGNNYADLGFGNDIAIACNREASFFGGMGDDTLIGGVGNDWLMGYDGADVLVGGKGDDFIIFDIDDEVVSGGKGQDTFVFYETVLDFTLPLNEISTAVSAQDLFFQQIVLSGAVNISDFNIGEGDVLDMSAMNLHPWDVYSNTETNTTVFVGSESTVAVVGISFYDVNDAIQLGNLILDNGGKG